MRVANRVLIAADPGIIDRLASDVERWPEVLPHYRWVRVLARRPDGILVQVAARRDCILVSWTSIQRRLPEQPRILFQHVRGITAGMAAEWRLESRGELVEVTIEHDFRPA